MVAIANPLSLDQAFMRTMLLPGLLETARRNASVREERVHIFEVGKVFLPSASATARRAHARRASWWPASGTRTPGCARGAPVDYFLGKGLVERLAGGLHAPLTFSRPDADGGQAEPFLHPGKSAVVSTGDGTVVGWVGEVHPLVAQAYDLKGTVVAAELDLGVLIEASADVLMFRDLLAFPAVEQDLALCVDAAVPAAAVVEPRCARPAASCWRTSACSTCTKAPRWARARRAWRCA